MDKLNGMATFVRIVEAGSLTAAASSLDTSLLDRAHRAADSTQLAELLDNQVPSWATGAADVRIFVVRKDGHAFTTDAATGSAPLGEPEVAVARGESGESGGGLEEIASLHDQHLLGYAMHT